MSSSSRSPFPSATALLIRDEPAFEVLMVRRHHQIEFASGALVFPGGKVEPGDRDPAWAEHAPGWDSVAGGEGALRICAIREAFEESGILLARHSGDGSFAIGARAAPARESVARGELSFLALVAELDLQLDLAAMTPFAHWITPAAMPKRFDTTFYLASAPADQLAACDGCETVDAEWIAPVEALALGRRGERTLVFPTRLNLQRLAESGGVAEAFAAARERPLVTVEPCLERRESGTFVSIGPEAGYGAVEAQRF